MMAGVFTGRRTTLWMCGGHVLAAAAALMFVLAGLSPLWMPSGSTLRTIPICSTQGLVKTVADMPGFGKGTPAGKTGKAGTHCPFCTLRSALALAPVLAAVPLPVFGMALTLSLFQGRLDVARDYRLPNPRAPPSFS